MYSHCGGMLSQCGGMLSLCGGMLSLCGGMLNQCGSKHSQCGGTLSRCGGMYSRCCGVLNRCGGVWPISFQLWWVLGVVGGGGRYPTRAILSSCRIHQILCGSSSGIIIMGMRFCLLSSGMYFNLSLFLQTPPLKKNLITSRDLKR